MFVAVTAFRNIRGLHCAPPPESGGCRRWNTSRETRPDSGRCLKAVLLELGQAERLVTRKLSGECIHGFRWCFFLKLIEMVTLNVDVKVHRTRMNLQCLFRVFVTKKSDVPPGFLPVFLECAHGNGPIWFPSFGFNVWVDAVLLAFKIMICLTWWWC